ncbi:MAG: hypothetical protein RR708_04365 [Bacilli bacterium]
MAAVPLTGTTVPTTTGGWSVKLGAGTSTNVIPTVLTDFDEIGDIINKLPNFFPTPEKLEYKTLDSKQTKSIQGGMPPIDGPLSVYFSSRLFEVHKRMVTFQNDATKGNCFWLVVNYKDEKRTVYCRCTVNEKIPTSQEESGSLTPVELSLSNIDEAVEEKVA